MCHFITAIIDNQTTVDELNNVGQGNAITFDICDNAFVKAQLNAHEEYLVKRTKFCDCGTHLGLATRTKSPDNSRVERAELEKLIKRGWSETKIRRWLTDRKKTIAKDKVRYDRIVNGVYVDMENWLNYLNHVFTATTIRHFGILLHWYTHGTKNERINIKKRVKIKLTELSGDILLNIDEDVVYEVQR